MSHFLFSLRRLLLLLLLLLTGAAGVYFFQPLSLPPLPEEAVRVDVSCSRLQPYEIEQETYTLSPDSDQWAQLEELLSQIILRMGDQMYHLGWWDDLAGQELAEGLAQILAEG